MSEFNGSTMYGPEIAQATFDEPTRIQEGPLHNEIEGSYLSEKTLVQEVSAVDATPEMPESHPDVDVKLLTIGGLIKACPHYARLAETNLELATAQATEVVQRVHERETMRDAGMHDAAIKKQQWASMRTRHKTKIEAEKKVAPEDTRQEPELESVPKNERVDEDNTRQPKTPEPVSQPLKAEKEKGITPMHTTTTKQNDPEFPRIILTRADVKEQAYTPIEATLPPSDTQPIPPQERSAAAAFKRAQFDVQPKAILDSTLTIPEYNLLHNLEADIEANPTTIVDSARHDDILPDELFLNETTVETTGVPAERILEFSPAVSSLADKEATLGPIETIDTPEAYIQAKAPEGYVAAGIPEQTTWDDALEKKPLELYESFAEALRMVVTIPEQTLDLEENMGVDEPVMLIESIQDLPRPTMAATITERLLELKPEEKEVTAPILQTIVETVRSFDKLPATEVLNPEIIKTVQIELKELVVSLFEELGVAYKPEDIEYFVALLLRPDFQPAQSGTSIAVNLEKEGTHEIKTPFAQLVSSGLTDVQEVGKRLLGKLVLLATTHHATLEYELAV